MKQEHSRILDHVGAANEDGQGTTTLKEQVTEQQLSREGVTETTLFHFGESPVRVAVTDGHYLFVVADLCAALQHSDPSKAIERLDEDEKGAITVRTLGGPQAVNVVNESGLYSLVLSSRKALAKRFKRWVTHEVLPSIRRTGSYSLPGAEQPAPILANGGPEFRRIVTMVVGRRVYSYEQPAEMLMTEIEEIGGRLMALGLSMAELHLLEVEQTVAMGMSVEGTAALNQLGTTIRSGALIAKRWLRARADAAEGQKDKMH